MGILSQKKEANKMDLFSDNLSTLILLLSIGALIFFLFKLTMEVPPVGLVMIAISVTCFGILYYHHDDDKNYTEKFNLTYSYVFKELKSEPENHPGAKCLVSIQNSEQEEFTGSEISQEKQISSNYENKYYISKSCYDFKNDLKSKTHQINTEIEKLRIIERNTEK